MVNEESTLKKRKEADGARWWKRAAIVVLLALAAWGFARQLPPANTDGFLFDYSNMYSMSKAWVTGTDPYRLDNVKAAWEQAPHSVLAPLNEGWIWVWAAVNPPTALATVAPLAILTPGASHVVWIALQITLFVLVCFALWEMGGLKSVDDRFLLVACLLAASPVIDGFQSGQLALPACAIVILSIWAVRRDRLVLAGLLLGLSMAIKFQVAGPFLLYFILLRHWRVAALTLGVFAVVGLIGVIPLEMHHVPWLHEWMANAAQTLRPGDINDPRPGALFRNDLINVQTWLYGLSNADPIVTLLTVLCVSVPATAFLVGLRRSDRPADDLLALSCVALLGLLPIYHRLYDATILALLLTWAMSALRTPMRRSAIITLILLAEIVVPIEIVPMVLRHAHGLNRFVSSWAWQMFVVPHHAWAILALALWTTGLYLSMHPRVVAAVSTATNRDELEMPEAVTG